MNRVSLLHAAELGRSKAPGFGGIQRGVQLESPRAVGQGVASRLGAYPKPGSPQTAQDPAYPAVSPLFNKGSIDPAGEKGSFPGEYVSFCPRGPSGLISRKMLI